MKKTLQREKLELYLWIGLAYMLLWLLNNLHTYPGNFLERVLNNLWRVLYIVPVNYVFFEHTLPFIGRRRNLLAKLVLYLFTFWVQLMLYSFGLYAWRLIGIGMGVYAPLTTYKSIMADVSGGFTYGFFSLVFFGVIRHAHNYIKLKQAAQQLRIEKQQAELNYLKSQTNPHFLFNTLNNIYALARDKSDLAPESILRLSQILRFMLYETNGDYIAIEHEIKIISDYIELERLRYDESLRVNFNHDVENPKQALPPLLLVPLVENDFKHGVSETRDRPSVDIHLSVRQRQLWFVVKNSTEEVVEERPVKENIGLSNLRRQLELLYTDYSLLFQQGKTDFTATLKINLASHVQNQMHHHRG